MFTVNPKDSKLVNWYTVLYLKEISALCIRTWLEKWFKHDKRMCDESQTKEMYLPIK